MALDSYVIRLFFKNKKNCSIFFCDNNNDLLNQICQTRIDREHIFNADITQIMCPYWMLLCWKYDYLLLHKGLVLVNYNVYRTGVPSAYIRTRTCWLWCHGRTHNNNMNDNSIKQINNNDNYLTKIPKLISKKRIESHRSYFTVTMSLNEPRNLLISDLSCGN